MINEFSPPCLNRRADAFKGKLVHLRTYIYFLVCVGESACRCFFFYFYFILFWGNIRKGVDMQIDKTLRTLVTPRLGETYIRGKVKKGRRKLNTNRQWFQNVSDAEVGETYNISEGRSQRYWNANRKELDNISEVEFKRERHDF